MTSTETILCRLESDAFGTPPRRVRVEARPCPPGFSVWYFDNQRCPEGEQIGRSDRHYHARELAQIIVANNVDIRALYVDGKAWLPAFEWSTVAVTGERGLRAHLLRRALTSWPCDWVLEKSDADYDAIDAAFGEIIDEELWEQLIDIEEFGDGELFELLSRHGVPVTGSAIRAFAVELKREYERPFLEREAQRQERIPPFRDEIETLAAKYSDRPVQGGGTQWKSHRKRMREFLEDYVVDHGRMPQGKIRYHTGNIDFDELRTREPWPPDRVEDPS